MPSGPLSITFVATALSFQHWPIYKVFCLLAHFGFCSNIGKDMIECVSYRLGLGEVIKSWLLILSLKELDLRYLYLLVRPANNKEFGSFQL